MQDGDRVPVLILDPGNFTPYYDLNLGDALARLGWRVEWVTARHPYEQIPVPRGIEGRYEFFGFLEYPVVARLARARSTPIVRRAVKALSYPLYMARLDDHLASRRPGVMHVQWALLPWVDAFFWKRWRQRGWRVVYTAHDALPLAGTTPRWLRASYTNLVRIADAIVVHSSAARRELEKVGVPSARVREVPQGGPGLFASRQPTPLDARSALGIDDRRPVVLFFGFLKPYKGVEVLLRSLAKVREAHPTVMVIIAGESTMPATAWDRTIRRLRISANVRFERGWVPRERVGIYFAAADLVALPYVSASSSAVLLVAYAHGRPVIATSAGGLPELIEHRSSGLIVPPDDAEALGDGLIDLLRDPVRLRSMGERARQLVDERHGWTEIAARTEAVYGELLRLENRPAMLVERLGGRPR
jgi:glycosyltransferase involved in cell wall biosynthesis